MAGFKKTRLEKNQQSTIKNQQSEISSPCLRVGLSTKDKWLTKKPYSWPTSANSSRSVAPPLVHAAGRNSKNSGLSEKVRCFVPAEKLFLLVGPKMFCRSEEHTSELQS